MKKMFYPVLAALITLPALAADVQPTVAEKEIAVVHFNQLKERKLEGNAKDLTLKPIMGLPGQTSYFVLQNDSFSPRTIVVSIPDLTEPEYDVYICGNLIGVKTKQELETGIPVSFSGTVMLPAYRDYFSRITARGKEGLKRYERVEDKDGSICKAVFDGVTDWVESIERGDRSIRSESIIVVSAGRAFSLPGLVLMPDKPRNLTDNMAQVADAIHSMRRDVAKKVKNTVYRNDSLEILSPLDAKLVLSGDLTPSKVVTVRAAFTNWTDRLVTGLVTLNVPSGWQVKPITPTVKMPGYSTKAEAKFQVTIPKTAKPDAKITAHADLTVQDVALKLDIK